MRTTLDLNDDLIRRAKRRAAASGTTLTALIEDGLRVTLARPARLEKGARVSLPTYGKGGLLPGVDVSNNASLEDIMDGLDDSRGR